MVIPVTAVLPQQSSPIPRYYRELDFCYRGFPAVTAVLPLSPLPCSSLTHNRCFCNHYHKFILAAKKYYYSSLVASSSANPRRLRKTVNNLLCHKSSLPLPSFTWFLAHDAFVRTNLRAIAKMFVRPSVCLAFWDGRARWSYALHFNADLN